MKKNLLFFLAGALMMAVFLVPAGVLAESEETISVIFDRVKVVVNGQPVTTQTILYNDTTYVPLRVIGEMLGSEVTWDGDINTAFIKNSDGWEGWTKIETETGILWEKNDGGSGDE